MELAIGIILGCCALGAGIAMIAGIGPGIGEGNAAAAAWRRQRRSQGLRSNRASAGKQECRHEYPYHGLRNRGDHGYLRARYRYPAHLRCSQYLYQSTGQR